MTARPPRGCNHFLALRLDHDTCDRLAAASERLRSWGLPARWTHADDYHLTLAFLGPVDDEEAALLPAAVDLVAGSFLRPTLRLVGVGARGGASEPKSVFAAVGDADHACAGMHQDLCAAVEIAVDARFAPHITLCRPQPVPSGLPLYRDWPHLLEAVGLAEWGACTATAVVLLRSSGSGATRYAEVAAWRLAVAGETKTTSPA